MAARSPSVLSAPNKEHPGQGKPTREQYRQLLLDECHRRGLVGWSDHVLKADITTAMGSLENWDVEERAGIKHFTELTPEEWMDMERFPGSINVAGINQKKSPYDHSGLQEMAIKAESGNERSNILTQYASEHVKDIEVDTYKRYLKLSGREGDWQYIQKKNSVNTILYWLAATENLEKAVKEKENPARTKSDNTSTGERVEIIILGDIPQEDVPTLSHFFIPRILSLAGFRTQVANLPFIRHFVQINNSDLAAALFKFVPDEIVASKPRNSVLDNAATSFLAPLTTIAYDNTPSHGWSALIANLPSRNGERRIDVPSITEKWREVDTEEEWENIKRAVAASHGKRTAYLRHKSVEDHVAFIRTTPREEVVYAPSDDALDENKSSNMS